jgi:hypothetical protein
MDSGLLSPFRRESSTSGSSITHSVCRDQDLAFFAAFLGFSLEKMSFGSDKLQNPE